MVLTQKAAAVAGLVVVSRLMDPPGPYRAENTKSPPAGDLEIPPVPVFLSDVAGPLNVYFRALLNDGNYLFTAFYSDGRVRLAMAPDRRFSGVVIKQKALIADLREDSSFEMLISGDVQSDDVVTLNMDGGPFEGQTLQGKRVR
ncbi:MAG: hypothetical protein NVS9B12_12460 [Vulcanimicrobiaceae bacterium]